MEAFVVEQTLSVSLNTAVFITWLIILVLYIIFSAILVYHWREYATNTKVSRRTLRLYFTVTGVLLLSASILWFFI